MKLEGITGIYKKTYLDNDMYRFDFSHHVNGYLDDETGCFYDEFENEIPFIRDVYFLDSKENIGHYGFIRYEELPFTFQGTTDEEIADYEVYLYAYDMDSKNRMILVSVVEDYDNNKQDTIVTEIDLEDIHKKSISYYMDFITEDEVLTKRILTMNMDLSSEDVIKLVKSGKFSYDELKILLEKYKEPYKDAYKIMDKCAEIINEYSEGKTKLSIEGRDPNFDISKPIEVNVLLDVLEKRQVTIKELKSLFEYFDEYLKELEPLIDAIRGELKRVSKIIEEEQEIEEKSSEKEETVEQYSLDDLKKLREVVKEYLVGQDEPLRRLVSELSRMKDKDFEDNVGILLSGDSGVGKTFMVQLVAKYLGVPFVRVDSTDLTVPGYVGRDLEEVLWELYEKSGRDVEAAEHGILFFDEIDKKGSNKKDDISGMGVLNHLLTLIDGSDVYACKSTKSIGMQEEVKLNSKHMIIIAAGSFPDVYQSKKRSVGFNTDSDDVDVPNKTPNTNVFVEKAMMSSDFMNRLPIRIRLNSLTEKDFEDNFTYGKDSPIRWEETSFSKHGVKLTVTPEFIKKASELSLKEGSGFRGSKGIILTATSDALDDVKENEDKYSEVILTDKTLDNPSDYKKVLKKQYNKNIKNR